MKVVSLWNKVAEKKTYKCELSTWLFIPRYRKWTCPNYKMEESDKEPDELYDFHGNYDTNKLVADHAEVLYALDADWSKNLKDSTQVLSCQDFFSSIYGFAFVLPPNQVKNTFLGFN